jgi:uncharacterized membrane protein YozB (DUF420 family)
MGMDPKLLFWTGALVNMWLIVAIACSGIAKVRSGDEGCHQRRMLSAGSLVVLFVLAYGLKLLFLGREDLDQWQEWAVILLRIHEVFVFGMIVGGTRAASLMCKVRKLEAQTPEDGAIQVLRVTHGKTGKFTFVSCLGAAITASGVLLSMFLRMG